MDYSIIVTNDAEEDLDRINFLKHRYFMLYRIESNLVFIDDIFHELQDYENKMI